MADRDPKPRERVIRARLGGPDGPPITVRLQPSAGDIVLWLARRGNPVAQHIAEQFDKPLRDPRG